jgi:mutator protein MutT
VSYIEEMRAVIGHRRFIVVAAGALILNQHKHLLLQRRSDDGLWGIPGGSMEIGESTEDAVRREIHEEIGLQIGTLALFDVFSGREMFHTYPNGDQVAVVSVVYITDDVHGAIERDDEGTELRYIPMEELPLISLSAPNKPIIQRFLEQDT